MYDNLSALFRLDITWNTAAVPPSDHLVVYLSLPAQTTADATWCLKSAPLVFGRARRVECPLRGHTFTAIACSKDSRYDSASVIGFDLTCENTVIRLLDLRWSSD